MNTILRTHDNRDHALCLAAAEDRIEALKRRIADLEALNRHKDALIESLRRDVNEHRDRSTATG